MLYIGGFFTGYFTNTRIYTRNTDI